MQNLEPTKLVFFGIYATQDLALDLWHVKIDQGQLLEVDEVGLDEFKYKVEVLEFLVLQHELRAVIVWVTFARGRISMFISIILIWQEMHNFFLDKKVLSTIVTDIVNHTRADHHIPS